MKGSFPAREGVCGQNGLQLHYKYKSRRMTRIRQSYLPYLRAPMRYLPGQNDENLYHVVNPCCSYELDCGLVHMKVAKCLDFYLPVCTYEYFMTEGLLHRLVELRLYFIFVFQHFVCS